MHLVNKGGRPCHRPLFNPPLDTYLTAKGSNAVDKGQTKVKPWFTIITKCQKNQSHSMELRRLC